MRLISLHDKGAIEQFLRQNTPIHLYELGDLDDFFWPYTTWYGLEEDGQVRDLVLLYTAMKLPVVLAITDKLPEMRVLVQALLPVLPGRFVAHLSGDLSSILAQDYRIDSYGPHYKMVLQGPSRLATVDTSEVLLLRKADLDDLQSLYHESYPVNTFEPRMLQTGHYYGIRRDGGLVAVAGVHVYSQRYRVGVIGNVTTHPDFRGQGLAKATCARLCNELLKTVDTIGLNVKADNASAVKVYWHLGFQVVEEYEECLVVNKI